MAEGVSPLVPYATFCSMPTFVKCPVMIVVVEVAFHLVVRHIDVRPAVSIEIAHGHAHRAPGRLRDARVLGNIRKRAVAVVVEQAVGSPS